MDCLLYYQESYKKKMRRLEDRVKERNVRSRSERHGSEANFGRANGQDQRYHNEIKILTGNYVKSTPTHSGRMLRLRVAQNNLTEAVTKLDSLSRRREIYNKERRNRSMEQRRSKEMSQERPTMAESPSSAIQNVKQLKKVNVDTPRENQRVDARENGKGLLLDRNARAGERSEVLARKKETVAERNASSYRSVSQIRPEVKIDSNRDLNSSYDSERSILELHPEYNGRKTKALFKNFADRHGVSIDAGRVRMESSSGVSRKIGRLARVYRVKAMAD